MSDVGGAALSGFQGDVAGAAASVVSMIPVFGGIPKVLAKIQGWAKVIAKILKAAKTDARLAVRIRPQLIRIRQILDKVPYDKLRSEVAEELSKIRDDVADFLKPKRRPKPTPAPKAVIIDGGKHPGSAGHARDAIDDGVVPGGVVDRSGAKPRRNDRLENEPSVPGMDRDGFPPAMLDNGTGGHSVRPVMPGDNCGAGASIGQQLRSVQEGTPLIIRPINVPPTKL